MSFDGMTLPTYKEYKEKENLDEYYRQFFNMFEFVDDGIINLELLRYNIDGCMGVVLNNGYLREELENKDHCFSFFVMIILITLKLKKEITDFKKFARIIFDTYFRHYYEGMITKPHDVDKEAVRDQAYSKTCTEIVDIYTCF